MSQTSTSPFAFSSPAPELHLVEQEPEEKSLRILLAEDNHELRRLLSFVLRREGHTVVEVSDASALLEALAFAIVDGGRESFDVVICEQNIPGIPGLAVLEGLRASARATPFILISGNAGVHDKARALGAVVLDRPLTVGAIRGAVQRSG